MFDYLEHYQLIFKKYNKFIKDFRLLAHIASVEISKQNPYSVCRYHENEPSSHAKAKNKIFNLFLKNHSYLTEAELKPAIQLNVFHLGDLAYRFDLLIVNVNNFIKLHGHIINSNLNNESINIKELKDLEQCLIFAVEIDGKSHVDKKDTLRDDFFFDEYNIITVRYDVRTLVKMEETEKESKARVRYSFFKKQTDPLYENITTDQIVQECRNIYRTKYPHLQ